MRKLDHKVFTEKYNKVTKAVSYMGDVRELDVGDSIAIPASDKEDAGRKRHNIITDASNMRKRGLERKYQTVIMSEPNEPSEVWVRRVE
jgi:CHAD domain-containing protein